MEGRPFSVLGDIKIVVTKAAFLIFICAFHITISHRAFRLPHFYIQ